MIRIKAGAPRGEMPPLSLSPAVTGAGAAARAGTRLRAALARRARRTERLLAPGLPPVWGATAITYRHTGRQAQHNGPRARIVTGAVVLAVGTGLMLHVRQVLLRELRRAREAAGAAHRTLLRPLPARIDGLATAAAQLSADPGAAVGGDLYDVIATEHGVRVVMGDVRGHGIGAVGTVAAVLGCFREAVHDEAELACVLRRLERALARHLRERARAEHPSAGLDPDSPVSEEFVTVLLLEIRRDGAVHALNCGHPWPYLLGGGRARLVADTEPLPPLGPFPLPAELPLTDCGHLRPGEALFLHTDGVTDARDSHGRFFPLPTVLAEAVRTCRISPRTVLRAVFAQLLRHTGGRPADDVALLVLCNDREPSHVPVGARGPARPATTAPQSANHL